MSIDGLCFTMSQYGNFCYISMKFTKCIMAQTGFEMRKLLPIICDGYN